MASSLVTAVQSLPNHSFPRELFDLRVTISRPLGGPKETVSVPVRCRDPAYTLSPSEVPVELAKDAVEGSGNADASIDGAVTGSSVVLVIEATLNATATCTHRLKRPPAAGGGGQP